MSLTLGQAGRTKPLRSFWHRIVNLKRIIPASVTWSHLTQMDSCVARHRTVRSVDMDDEELRRGITASLRDWPGWEGLSRVVSQHPGFRIFALGGSIRDVLLQRSTPSKDFDFIVHGTGSREAVQSLSEFGRLTYGPFGSARWY